MKLGRELRLRELLQRFREGRRALFELVFEMRCDPESVYEFDGMRGHRLHCPIDVMLRRPASALEVSSQRSGL
jgi:hypothetical protein